MSGPAYATGVINASQNDDWVVPFVLGTPVGDGTVTPIDLTGSIIKLEMRVNESDNEAIVAVWSPDGGVTITDAVNGRFQVLIDRDHLRRIPAGTYFCDMVRLMPSGYQERLWEGTATVIGGTTR